MAGKFIGEKYSYYSIKFALCCNSWTEQSVNINVISYHIWYVDIKDRTKAKNGYKLICSALKNNTVNVLQ